MGISGTVLQCLVLALPWQHPVTNGLLDKNKHEGSYFPKHASKSLTEHVPNICSLLQTFVSYETEIFK